VTAPIDVPVKKSYFLLNDIVFLNIIFIFGEFKFVTKPNCHKKQTIFILRFIRNIIRYIVFGRQCDRKIA